MTSHERADHSALSDRMTYLLWLRIAMALIVMLWALVRPEALGVSLTVLAVGSGIYVVGAVVVELARRRFPASATGWSRWPCWRTASTSPGRCTRRAARRARSAS